mmetsp:Transcript_19461/g.50619  ORF Transcript_19461/g.50619 Transcript_19461/m.50619 type:complete len:227 (-) Transcript_19461:164-844(-)
MAARRSHLESSAKRVATGNGRSDCSATCPPLSSPLSFAVCPHGRMDTLLLWRSAYDTPRLLLQLIPTGLPYSILSYHGIFSKVRCADARARLEGRRSRAHSAQAWQESLYVAAKFSVVCPFMVDGSCRPIISTSCVSFRFFNAFMPSGLRKTNCRCGCCRARSMSIFVVTVRFIASMKTSYSSMQRRGQSIASHIDVTKQALEKDFSPPESPTTDWNWALLALSGP